MNYKQDCLYFKTDMPCVFHKENPEVNCDSCKFYLKLNKKILIIKLGALGDVVRTTSILKPLWKKYKHSKIFWITDEKAISVFKNNPYVSEVISYNEVFLYFNEFFDILINLDLDNKALVLTKKFSCAKKYGFYLNENNDIVCSNQAAQYWFDMSHNDILKKQNKKTYQQHMLEILEFKNLKPKDYPIVIKLSDEEKKFARDFLIKNHIKNISETTFIGINLAAGDKWIKKEYPIDSTIKLIMAIVDNFKDKEKLKILLFGGEKEEKRNFQILEFLKKYPSVYDKILDTGCRNTLRNFFSLINLCDLVVTSDTLALHVGLALGKKIIALFGPTSFNEIEMYNLGVKIITPKKCRVCYRKICNEKPDCMQSISVDGILSKILKLVRR